MESSEKSLAWICKSGKRINVLLCMRKPAIKTDVEKKFNSISLTRYKLKLKMADFVRHGLTYCINPRAKEGRVYCLTNRGINIARGIAREKSIPWNYSVPEIRNWSTYGWVACGNRRKNLLFEMMKKVKATTVNPTGRIKAEKIICETPRSYKYNLIKDFLKKGLLKKETVSGITIYSLRRKGKRIAEALKN